MSEVIETSERKKRFHPKTRDGCLTCRQRRVKCSGERPSCVRCQNAKRICAGYSSIQQTEWQILTPSTQAKRRSLVKTCLPTTVCSRYGAVDEQRSLDFYLRRTGPMISMSGPMKELWTIVIPQASWRYSEVKNMLISLSLLDQYLASCLPALKLEAELRPALEHYNKSIHSLLRKQKPLSCILLVSVLAYLFDSMGDHRESAMVHLKATKDLVSGSPITGLQARTAEDCFTTDIVREALKTAGYMYTDPSKVEERLVPRFSSLQMAQLRLWEIVQGVRSPLAPNAGSVQCAFDTLSGWRKAMVRYRNIGSEPLKDKRATVVASGLVGTYLHVIDPEQSLSARFANGYFTRVLADIEHVIEHEDLRTSGWVVRLVLKEIELVSSDAQDLRERARGLLLTNETMMHDFELGTSLPKAERIS